MVVAHRNSEIWLRHVSVHKLVSRDYTFTERCDASLFRNDEILLLSQALRTYSAL
jgi:hypothetical protein